MAIVKVDISPEFKALCDQVTAHRNTLSWIIFHTGAQKKGIQTKTEIELISKSDGVVAPDQVFPTIREAITADAKTAKYGIPRPQFILLNLPIQSQETKKNVLVFVSLCHNDTPVLANFTHASSQQTIIRNLHLDSMVHQFRAIPISTLDELELEGLSLSGTIATE